MTLTVATASPAIFRSTGGGTGIQASGEGITGNAFQVNSGETFTLTFDTPGTLTGLTARVFPTSTTVTATNGTSVSTDTVAVTSGFVDDTFDFSTTFAAGEAVTISTAAVGTGNNVGFRIQSVTIDAIPEPASLALVGAAAPSCSAVAARVDASSRRMQAAVPAPRCHHLQVVSDPCRLTT